MGCEYKLICYDCKVSVYLGKIYLGLEKYDALKVWLFLLKHNGHRLGLLGSDGEFQDFYLYGFPEDKEVLKEVEENIEEDIPDWEIYWKVSNAKRADDELLAMENRKVGKLFTLTFEELRKVKNVNSLKEVMRKFFTKKEFEEISEGEWEGLWLKVKKWIKDVGKKYNLGEDNSKEKMNYCNERECPFWKNGKCLYNNGCLIVDVNKFRFDSVKRNFLKLKENDKI